MDVTPWIETVNDGWNILVGNDTEKVIELARNFEPRRPNSNLFELGACEKIAQIINCDIGHMH